MLKRHVRQQHALEEYGRNIKQLAARAQSLLSAGHPEGCVCWVVDIRPGAPPTRIPSGPSGKTATVLGITGFEATAFWTAGWPSSISCLGFA